MLRKIASKQSRMIKKRHMYVLNEALDRNGKIISSSLTTFSF